MRIRREAVLGEAVVEQFPCCMREGDGSATPANVECTGQTRVSWPISPFGPPATSSCSVILPKSLPPTKPMAQWSRLSSASASSISGVIFCRAGVSVSSTSNRHTVRGSRRCAMGLACASAASAASSAAEAMVAGSRFRVRRGLDSSSRQRQGRADSSADCWRCAG